jgi:predicted outer membrane repeat protein
MKRLATLVSRTGLVALCLALFPVSAAILRVKSGSTNQAPDGLTWAKAFPDIADALAVAKNGDEVWVAAGVYGGGLVLSNGIALYGGFAGAETARDQRDFVLHQTVLDGLQRTNLVVIAPGAGPATRVDGFIISNGRATSSGTGTRGAGVRVVGADPVLANNRFLANNASGLGNAVYLQDSAAVVISNYFGFNGTNLTATVDGGAIAALNSSPRIEGNSLVGNRGRDGGAIHLANTTGFLAGNQFLNNTATRDGGALFCQSASPQITHNRLLGNAATARGGGIVLLGGSASLVFNNVLVRNAAATGGAELSGGGGAFVDGTSQPSLINNTLVMNTAPVGGLLVSNRNATIANNLIAHGTSGVGGVSGLRLQANNVFGNGTNYVDIPDATGTDGNISADPRFAGDISVGVINILPGSPCRDVGNSLLVPPQATDIEGLPRVQGPAVDIGAHETDGATTEFLPVVIRVAVEGNDANDGRAWAKAKHTLQAAIETAGWQGGEVWVKTGTYVENPVLRPFVSLFGGFVGVETNRLERNWTLYETILDGGGALNVLRLPNLNFDETVDGFTIRNGAAPAGGGILARGSVRIQNNRFVLNTAVHTSSAVRGGGAIYLDGGNARVANNIFFRNRAVTAALAVTADGGAIKVADGAPLIINNLFRLNSVTNSAARGETRGGALLVVSNAHPQIVNNTFLQNSALVSNGATNFDQGGALLFAGVDTNVAPEPLLANNLIAYNSSGVSAPGRIPDIRANLLWGNIRTNYEWIADPTGTAGNISANPRLTGPYGDPHLAADSPARDAGDSALVSADWRDLDGKARIVGTKVDIGVDEFDGTLSPIMDRIVHVKPGGSDTNSGTSWAAAKKTVRAALEEAALEGGEVWVQAGVYEERVRVELFTYLYGGFAGTETNRAARNWAANPTVLHGGARAVNPTPGAPVVTVIGLDGYAAVDGFTIQNGAARLGAGLNVFGSAYIAHNLIRSNVVVTTSTNLPPAGGGLYCEFGAPTIVNNVFVANNAPLSSGQNGRGGAIYLATPPGHLAGIYNNTFLTNRAAGGGGAVFLGTGTGARIVNNIVAFGSSGLESLNTTNVAAYNCVFGNSGDAYVGVIAGLGSLAVDPRFVNWSAGNYRLRADSPCINVGDPTAPLDSLDIYAEPRLVQNAPELGADEFSGPAEADFSLALTQPLPGLVAVAPATVFLSASVQGGTLMPAYVEYLGNDVVLAVGTSAPYSSVTPGLLAGEYNLVARAITAGGALKTSAPVAITIVPPPGNVPPTVTITTPANLQEFAAPAQVDVLFSWTKPGGRVIRWDMTTNGVLVAANPNVPPNSQGASVSMPNLGVGQYVVRVVATDNYGDKGTNQVTFLVTPAPSTAAPPQKLANGSVRFEFSAPSSQSLYVLESTPDFRVWTPVSTNAGGAPVVHIVPPGSLRPIEIFRTRIILP